MQWVTFQPCMLLVSVNLSPLSKVGFELWNKSLCPSRRKDCAFEIRKVMHICRRPGKRQPCPRPLPPVPYMQMCLGLSSSTANGKGCLIPFSSNHCRVISLFDHSWIASLGFSARHANVRALVRGFLNAVLHCDTKQPLWFALTQRVAQTKLTCHGIYS